MRTEKYDSAINFHTINTRFCREALNMSICARGLDLKAAGGRRVIDRCVSLPSMARLHGRPVIKTDCQTAIKVMDLPGATSVS